MADNETEERPMETAPAEETTAPEVEPGQTTADVVGDVLGL